MDYRKKTKKKEYDLIIVGAGPAGLTASIYASRYKINHLVIGKILGGLASEAYKVSNFPTEEPISGFELIKKMEKRMRSLGGELILDQVVGLRRTRGKRFLVTTRSYGEFLAKTLLLALGTEKRRLNLPGEEKFVGRGISYCITCDGPLFQNKIVGVVGGGNSAATMSLFLSEIAQKVYLICRENHLSANEMWQDEIKKNKKIKVIYGYQVKQVEGDGFLERVILINQEGKEKILKLEGLFVAIGLVPVDNLISHLKIKRDRRGFIKIEPDGSTSVKGVWAAGDITTGSNHFQQIITACAEGAIAVNSIHKYLFNKK